MQSSMSGPLALCELVSAAPAGPRAQEQVRAPEEKDGRHQGSQAGRKEEGRLILVLGLPSLEQEE